MAGRGRRKTWRKPKSSKKKSLFSGANETLVLLSITFVAFVASVVNRHMRGGMTIQNFRQEAPPSLTVTAHDNSLLRNIEVEVYAAGPGIVNVFDRAPTYPGYPMEFLNIYKNHFLNYSNDTRFDYLVDHGNMLVISYGSFMETVQPLVDWKNRKGIQTEMVNISDIGSSSSAIES